MTVGLLDVLSLLKSWVRVRVLPVHKYSGFMLGGTGIQQGRQAREDQGERREKEGRWERYTGWGGGYLGRV